MSTRRDGLGDGRVRLARQRQSSHNRHNRPKHPADSSSIPPTDPKCSLAQEEGDIYTPAITLWAFLSRTLHAQRLRSCVAAVSRVIVLYATLGREPPSLNSGAYPQD